MNSYLSNKGTLNGFAVQLVVTQDTKKVRELRKIFTELFPEEYLFDEYIAPNIFLYAGKYFTMSDAVSLQKKLENSFDNTMVVRKKFPLKVIQKKNKKGAEAPSLITYYSNLEKRNKISVFKKLNKLSIFFSFCFVRSVFTKTSFEIIK